MLSCVPDVLIQFSTVLFFSYNSDRTRGRLWSRWYMGTVGTHCRDRRTTLPAESATVCGCFPVSVPPEGILPQAEAGGGGPIL